MVPWWDASASTPRAPARHLPPPGSDPCRSPSSRFLLLDTPMHALAARRLYESHGFRERSAADLPPGCHFVVKALRIHELLLR